MIRLITIFTIILMPIISVSTGSTDRDTVLVPRGDWLDEHGDCGTGCGSGGGYGAFGDQAAIGGGR